MVVLDVDRTRRVPEALGGCVGESLGGRVRSGAGHAVLVEGSTRPRPWAWQPLSGDELLERLRVTGRRRPAADPELAGRLRDHLEQGLSAGGADATPGADRAGGTDATPGTDRAGGTDGAGVGPTLVVTKDRLTRALGCDAHRQDSAYGDRVPTVALACGALVDVLFRQLVTVGTITDPMGDGLAALSVDDRQQALVAWIERLPAVDGAELRAEVERQAEGLRRRWPRLESSWLPRTQESLRAPLLGGSVELSARVDLSIGRPPTQEASVALVEVKSGGRRAQHRTDLHFYALIETLRSQAPPFVVATYYTRTGELDVDPVTEELLAAAARRTVIGTRALQARRPAGDPVRAPEGSCGQCTGLPGCRTGLSPDGQGADCRGSDGRGGGRVADWAPVWETP